MKAIWNGAVSFGLVNIPVKLYSAVEQRPVSFKLIHETDGNPIEYRRWCAKGEHEVPWEEVVKGVDIGEGAFYVFSKQELSTLRPKRSDLIEIVQFVEQGALDRVYVDAHYYLGPEKPGKKAFFLLRETLERYHEDGRGQLCDEGKGTCLRHRTIRPWPIALHLELR